MSPPDPVIASLLETRLTLSGFLANLHSQGRLESLSRTALAEEFVQDQACRAGLSVTTEELQTAADDFRRRHGLHAAADTHAWLAARRLSVDDFEASLKRDVLANKLRQHLTSAEVDRHFAARKADFDRLRLARVVVGRENLARELASQVRDEGRELADVAREQGLRLVRVERFRKELSGPLTAAGAGQMVGPVGTKEGFLLVVVEECRPAELDSVTRGRIQDELFDGWLLARLREAKIDLALGSPT